MSGIEKIPEYNCRTSTRSLHDGEGNLFVVHEVRNYTIVSIDTYLCSPRRKPRHNIVHVIGIGFG